MSLTLAPVAFAEGSNVQASRVAILATDYLGNTKGQWYTDSFEQAAAYAADLVGHVDTKVYLFNTTREGEAVALPFVLITKSNGWTAHPSCLVDGCTGECESR